MTYASNLKAKKETALVNKGTSKCKEMDPDIHLSTSEWALEDPLLATAIDLVPQTHAYLHPRSRLYSVKIKNLLVVRYQQALSGVCRHFLTSISQLHSDKSSIPLNHI